MPVESMPAHYGRRCICFPCILTARGRLYRLLKTCMHDASICRAALFWLQASNKRSSMSKVIFFAIHSTTRWWKYIASSLDFADGVVLSDLRGEGDWVLVDDFYRFMRKGDAEAVAISHFGEDGCAEIILRCRSLRSLSRKLAL